MSHVTHTSTIMQASMCFLLTLLRQLTSAQFVSDVVALIWRETAAMRLVFNEMKAYQSGMFTERPESSPSQIVVPASQRVQRVLYEVSKHLERS